MSNKDNEISKLRTEVKQKENNYAQFQGIIDQVALNAGFKNGKELIRTFIRPDSKKKDLLKQINISKNNPKSLINV